MLFNSFEFWLFFLPVLTLVHLLRHRGQNFLLLAASYLFYAAWDWRFLSLILISTVVDYVAAPFAVASGNSAVRRKLAVAVSVVANLSILGFFKYCNFFIQSFTALIGLEQCAANDLFLNLTLPLGISFYTFQTMSYTLDVYSGKIAPTKKFLDFALYVSFFPQLVAGPIERGSNLMPQITHQRRIETDKIESACHLIVFGLFKKIFIADSLAHPVNTVFASMSPTGPEVYLATLCFAVQIYCDFSGYSDIARGVARLMGFHLMLNFNLPYFAKNPTDFWQRWHISLSSWLKDYLYIPLGGNRHGKLNTYRNLMITMILGGLWHGARFNFLLWGCYHGILLILHRWARRPGPEQKTGESRLLAGLKMIGMFHLTLIGWLLFRVESLSQLRRLIDGLIYRWDFWDSGKAILKYAAPFLVPFVLIQLWQWQSRDLNVINKVLWPLRALLFGVCLAVVLLLNQSAGTPFIYFQF